MKTNQLFFVLVFLVLCPFVHAQPASDTSKKKVLILTIDGGGIRGIIPAFILSKIEEEFKDTNHQTYQLFDVIGGTSTGGMIGLALTTPRYDDHTPISADSLVKHYIDDCNCIFNKNRRWSGPKYYARSGIERYLKQQLTDYLTLSEPLSLLPDSKVRQVFTTTYIVNSNGERVVDPVLGKDFGPMIFNWQDAIAYDSLNYYIWEAARGTSAAPIYFPIAHVGGSEEDRSPASEKWLIDGGVMSNNPSFWGISEALRAFEDIRIDDIAVISIGCGLDQYNGGIEILNKGKARGNVQKYGFWGLFDWMVYKMKNLKGEKTQRSIITETALYANQFVPEQQLNIMSNYSQMDYHRLQPQNLPYDLTSMDNCESSQMLLNYIQAQYDTTNLKYEIKLAADLIRRNL